MSILLQLLNFLERGVSIKTYLKHFLGFISVILNYFPKAKYICLMTAFDLLFLKD